MITSYHISCIKKINEKYNNDRGKKPIIKVAYKCKIFDSVGLLQEAECINPFSFKHTKTAVILSLEPLSLALRTKNSAGLELDR